MTPNETALREDCHICGGIYDTGMGATIHENSCPALQSPSQPVVAEGAEPLAWRYSPSVAHAAAGAVPIMRSYRDPHSLYTGWTETPLYAHPQASPPPVQSEKVSEADVKYLAFILEEWDMKDRPNAWTGHSYEDIARDALTRLSHSQPDTQEGE